MACGSHQRRRTYAKSNEKAGEKETVMFSYPTAPLSLLSDHQRYVPSHPATFHDPCRPLLPFCQRASKNRTISSTPRGCPLSSGKIQSDLPALVPPRPRRNGETEAKRPHHRGEKLAKGGLTHVHRSRDHPLSPPLFEPKKDSRHTPCRRKGRWAAPTARQVRCGQGHDLIGMCRGHAHVTKERATLHALLKKTPDKDTRVTGSPVALATNVYKVIQLIHLEELARITAIHPTRPKSRRKGYQRALDVSPRAARTGLHCLDHPSHPYQPLTQGGVHAAIAQIGGGILKRENSGDLPELFMELPRRTQAFHDIAGQRCERVDAIAGG